MTRMPPGQRPITDFLKLRPELAALAQSSYDFTAVVTLLTEHGPQLPYPYSSGIEGSKRGHMRELRVQSGGRPLRGFYAFDPRCTAILLIGGDKTGDDRFYKKMLPIADRLYDDYIAELRKEGLIK